MQWFTYTPLVDRALWQLVRRPSKPIGCAGWGRGSLYPYLPRAANACTPCALEHFVGIIESTALPDAIQRACRDGISSPVESFFYLF